MAFAYLTGEGPGIPLRAGRASGTVRSRDTLWAGGAGGAGPDGRDGPGADRRAGSRARPRADRRAGSRPRPGADGGQGLGRPGQTGWQEGGQEHEQRLPVPWEHMESHRVRLLSEGR